MLVSVRYRHYLILGGPRPVLERLRAEIKAKPPVVDRPARASLDLVLLDGMPELAVVERYVAEQGLSLFRRKELLVDKDEVSAAPLAALAGCSWLSDTFEEYDKPEYDAAGACAACGLGATRLSRELRISPGKIGSRGQLYRIPPALVLVSAKLAALIRSENWTGFRLRRVVDRATDVPTERFYHLEITSILPPMATNAPIERSPIPKHCDVCRRLGYQYAGEQARYPASVQRVACDWNLSVEWLAPHFVSCPFLVVSNRVAAAVGRLEKRLRWIPVQFD